VSSNPIEDSRCLLSEEKTHLLLSTSWFPRNGFKRDFSIELKRIEGLMVDRQLLNTLPRITSKTSQAK